MMKEWDAIQGRCVFGPSGDVATHPERIDINYGKGLNVPEDFSFDLDPGRRGSRLRRDRETDLEDAVLHLGAHQAQVRLEVERNPPVERTV